MPPLALRQLTKTDRAESGSDEAPHGVTESLTHPPNLTIAALMNGYLDYAKGAVGPRQSDLRGSCGPILQVHSHPKLHDVSVSQSTVNFGEIGLVHHVTGMCEGMSDVTIVRQQKEALAIHIKPAHRVYSLLDALEK